jgi:selenoprotein W-related protein
MKIEIEYCVPCGYLPRATEAQTRLLEEFGGRIESVALKTGSKGVFTFRADGDVIYSKPDEFNIDVIAASVAALLPAAEGVQVDGRDLLMGKMH